MVESIRLPVGSEMRSGRDLEFVIKNQKKNQKRTKKTKVGQRIGNG